MVEKAPNSSWVKIITVRAQRGGLPVSDIDLAPEILAARDRLMHQAPLANRSVEHTRHVVADRVGGQAFNGYIAQEAPEVRQLLPIRRDGVGGYPVDLARVARKAPISPPEFPIRDIPHPKPLERGC